MLATLEAALHPANLDKAWRALGPDRAHWQPGMARDEMEGQRLRHQLALIESVRQGRYRPEPMRQFTVPKANGGQRVLSALYLRDKFLQRAVAQVLEPVGERHFHADSYAYRPRRNVAMALQRCGERIRCGFPWLVDADIRAFFDEIPHGPLLSAFDALVRDRGLRSLVRLWLENFASTRSLFGGARGIPQGAVVSPFLCNVHLDALDREWARQRIPFVRYADDFLLFTPTEAEARRAFQFTERQLGRLGLALHPEKSRVVRASRDVAFLGARLPAPPAPKG
jgi:group II intron reverse transcriptase/maturase